ncbi:MAG: hypothetical protein KatS3mg035_0298 [Bacteroidia bacterium]|nr:MAG: hypothetical protein KatS3mg035_0298 [Bacteroidia bacterium]
MKKLIWSLLNSLRIGPWVQLAIKSELIENGWHQSFIKKKSIDKQGNPIPWLTYSFLDFIQPRLQKSFVMFEYGCGNSTLWFAKYVQHIDSVEHEKNWYEQIQPQLPSNAQLYFKDLNSEDYEKCILTTPHFYDIILIDGRKRWESAQNSIQKLKENGVIILDNSERYPEIFKFLQSQGFKEISFTGLAAIVPLKTCTTVFYKENNILGI